MTNFEKAARTALKGLAASGDFLFNWHDCDPDNAAEMQAYATALAAVTKATVALEEALDALAQEPAGQLMEQAYGRGQVLWFHKPQDLSMLYTSPPAQKQEPVAKDAEKWGSRLNQASWAAIEAWNAELMGPMSGAVFNNIKGVVRAAILKYSEGYTCPPAQKQEPVAWKHPVTADVFSTYAMAKKACCVGQEPIPLYTSPQRKPWVDLTQEEVEHLCVPLGAAMLSFAEVARVVAAKLKEKNT